MSAPVETGGPAPGPEDHTLLGLREMELNFGPQHPSTHGVLRIILKVDGERIVSARPEIGYLHRGTEKLFETETYPMVIPHTDRLDYVAAATNNHAYCLAVEKLLGLEVPKKAQYIRVLLDELQRISSHVLWLATAGIDLGAMTPFFYTFREREAILDLFEEYCGARLTLHCMRIGGLLDDLTPGFVQKVRAFAEPFDKRVDEYEELLTENRIWKKRTIDVGILNAERCVEMGVTGPPLRAAGFKWDIRRAIPYE
ncbi:MAG: NADH-quinone oxidoreductase subunit D, partial [Thermoanaerobaculia bacterium]